MSAPVERAADPEYVKLARHHLECERIAQTMADLLDHVRMGHKPPDMALRIMHVLAEWDQHQWPPLI